jgi:hypothetical protein
VPYSKQSWADGSGGGTPLNAARLSYIEDGIEQAQATADAAGGGGVAAADFGYVTLDSFAGASDDAKLTAALSFCAAQTYPPTIKLAARNHTFATGARAFYTGLRIEGAPGYSNPERNSGTKAATRCSLSMSGGWFEHTGGDVFSMMFRDLALTGGSNASFITRNPSATGTLYCLEMSGIYSSGLRTLIGTQTNKVLLTAASWFGSWEINNCYNGAFHLGGSDNVFWVDGMLLDSGTAFNSAGSANGQYHIWFNFMEKSYIGPLYITSEGAWNGIRISGPSNPATSGGSNLGGPLNFFGMRLEGRNAGAPCNGSLFRIEGGSAILRDCWISYGMASPATPGHSPQDAGIIHQTAGILIADGCSYDRANTVAETVPWIYCNGGELMVGKIMRGSKGGTWTGRPRVDQAAGTVLVDDASVTVI